MAITEMDVRTERQESFTELIKQYQGRIYTVILGYVRSREDALDLTQEVFLKAYRSLDRLKDSEKFPAWICSIARNMALNYLKRSRLERALLDDLGRAKLGTEPVEETGDVLAAIETLNELYRIPFLLKYMEGCPVDEIAVLLDVPVSTVEGRLYQARLQLRRKLIK